MLYLDNAATTLKKPASVYASMIYNTLKNSVNAGHGGHYYSLRGAKGIYDAAEALSALLGISNPERIAFTQNATYALNMGIRGLVSENDHVVTTAMEHNSVLRTLHSLCNYTLTEADSRGYVRPDAIEAAIKPETKLIVVNHISNVSGTVQNIKEIGRLAKKHNIPLMVDAAQSIGATDINAEDMGIDMLAFSGHKGLMGPLGVGCLYVSDRIQLKPSFTGGTGSDSKNLNQPEVLPDMLQPGTLNTPAIIACGSAARYIKKRGASAIGEEETYLAVRFIEKIKNIINVNVYGNLSAQGRNSTVAFNINGVDSVELAERLNKEYFICVRGGWHCAYPAHCAIGTEKTGAVRASFGAFNTIHSADKLADAVYKISRECK